MEGAVVNQQLGCSDARGKQRLASVVRANRRATVGQTDEKVTASPDGKVSEHTVHHAVLCMELHSCRAVRVPNAHPMCRASHSV